LHVFFIKPTDSEFTFLNEDENHHAAKVLRVKVGDQALLLDGIGNYYVGQFLDVASRNSQLKILSKESQKPRPYNLHVAIAPTKMMDRFEWFLEKATEIGIDEITPILSKRGERNVVKMQRMEKIVHSALKQSQNAFHPKINELISLDEFIQLPVKGIGLIAHCMDSAKSHLLNVAASSNNLTVLVGPEGDFTPEEIQKAINKNYQAISLGDSRLRAETAGVIVCSQVNAAWFLRTDR
jgi:16S rRNA (uracil1498-N3)-methyltransferase